jgi:F0F1-type ATP synthase assembly protein I
MITQFAGQDRVRCSQPRTRARRDDARPSGARGEGGSSASGRGYEYGGPAFPGGILVGIGLGILLGDFFAWLLIGIGAGFILMGFIAALARR